MEDRFCGTDWAYSGESTVMCGFLVFPKPVEAGGRQLGVPHGVLNVLVAEVVL